MGRFVALLKGIALGAGLMYFYDPDQGRYRRALVRDKVTHTLTEVGETVETTTRDLRNRTEGILATARSLFTTELVSDTTLVERIRAKMGHVVSHPHRIQVVSRFGRVTISGSIPADGVDALFRCVASVRGVVSVDMSLTEEGRQTESDAPSLVRYAEAKPHWSPSTRLLVGVAGGLLTLYGKRRGGLLGTAASTVGAGLLTSSIRNRQIPILSPSIHVGRHVAPIESADSTLEDEQDMGLSRTTEHTRRPAPSY